MTPLILHIIILGLLFLPALITILFYLHYRFLLKEYLKYTISEISQITVRRVRKKGKIYEDGEEVPRKEATGILMLVGFVTLSIFWITHAGITSLYFYVVSPTYFEVLVAHLLSFLSLNVLHLINRKKS